MNEIATPTIRRNEVPQSIRQNEVPQAISELAAQLDRLNNCVKKLEETLHSVIPSNRPMKKEDESPRVYNAPLPAEIGIHVERLAYLCGDIEEILSVCEL